MGMILQYIFYDEEARKILTADPMLAYLYDNHAKGFEQRPPGVEVRDAGCTQVNGWYRRMEHGEGPPRIWPSTNVAWIIYGNAGRRWYEKDDGGYIYCRDGDGHWRIFAQDSLSRYTNKWYVRSDVPLDTDPPTDGWGLGPYGSRGRDPAPTLRVTD